VVSSDFSALCQHAVFKKYSCERVGTHLKSLCVYFLLGTHVIKVQVNRMAVISPIRAAG